MNFDRSNTSRPHAVSRNRISGFSLIELMVAITLGLVLTAGMIQLFSSTKLTFQTNDGLARVQENGRFAIEILKRELRQAGTHGFCAGRIEITNHLNDSCGGGAVDFFDPDRTITGWEYVGTGPGDDYTIDLTETGSWSSSAASGSSLPSTLQGLVLPGSDVLVNRRLEIVPGVTADPNAGNDKDEAEITLLSNHDLDDDAIVLVTNCASGVDLFQNQASADNKFSGTGGSCGAPGPGNNSLDWSTAYDDSMQAFQVSVVAYYIGRNAATGEPGLFRLDMSNGTLGATQEELVQGAETLQILYGFSDAAPAGDGQSVDAWRHADQVPADGWQQVIALRLSMSIRSPENADGDDTDITFDLSGANVTATGDGRMRQPFSATIALRNRLLVI